MRAELILILLRELSLALNLAELRLLTMQLSIWSSVMLSFIAKFGTSISAELLWSNGIYSSSDEESSLSSKGPVSLGLILVGLS